LLKESSRAAGPDLPEFTDVPAAIGAGTATRLGELVNTRGYDAVISKDAAGSVTNAISAGALQWSKETSDSFPGEKALSQQLAPDGNALLKRARTSASSGH